VRGDLAPFVFYFPQPLAFFGFSPHNFLIRAKCTNSKKRPKVEDMTRFHTCYVRPQGSGFSFGWMGIGAKKKI